VAKRLTRKEYLKAVARPRQRFRRMTGAPTKVHLREPIGSAPYWFQRDDLVENGGRYWHDPHGTISLVRNGKTSVLFYCDGPRLEACCFAFVLTRNELKDTIALMRRVGLRSLVRATAVHTLGVLPAQHRKRLGPSLCRIVCG
jgi:hypothetical protein